MATSYQTQQSRLQNIEMEIQYGNNNKGMGGQRDLLGIIVQPLDLHLVNVGSIPTRPTHGEGRPQPHPGDVLKSTPNVRKSPRSG